MTILIVNGGSDGEYVGRPSPLGNPYPLTKGEASRDYVCDKYDVWLEEQLKDPESAASKELARLTAKYAEDKVLKLRCFCHPKRCHALSIKRRILDASVANRNLF